MAIPTADGSRGFHGRSGHSTEDAAPPVADGSEEEEQFRISGASRMRQGDPIVAASTSSMKNVESPRLDRLICCLILQNYKGREEDVVVADDGALGIWCLCGTWRCPRGQRPCSAALDLQPTHEPHRRPLTMVIYQTCFLQLTVLGNLHRG